MWRAECKKAAAHAAANESKPILRVQPEAHSPPESWLYNLVSALPQLTLCSAASNDNYATVLATSLPSPAFRVNPIPIRKGRLMACPSVIIWWA